MRGALRVLCIGAPMNRLTAATAAGASAVLNFEELDEAARLEWVLDRTNQRGADATIEATGAPAAVVQAMRFTRDAGRLVEYGSALLAQSLYSAWFGSLVLTLQSALICLCAAGCLRVFQR